MRLNISIFTPKPAIIPLNTKKPAKNRLEIRLSQYPGWGINKHFWPEYSPLMSIDESILLRSVRLSTNTADNTK